MSNRDKILSVFIIMLCFLAVYLAITIKLQGQSKMNRAPQNSAISFLPTLYTEGTYIRRKDTDQIVILRGATTDYFRWEKDTNVDNLIKRVDALHSYGMNMLGVYLGPYDADDIYGFYRKMDDLDTLVKHSQKKGIYLYLIPVARNYSESSWMEASDTKLTDVVKLLSSRYKKYNHIFYGFGAEVGNASDLDWPTWRTRQTELAKIVNQNNPDALILATSNYFYNLREVALNPLPIENVIYCIGGYVGQKEETVNLLNEEKLRQKILNITYDFKMKSPVVVCEFGGYYEDDFSSKSDLDLTRSILIEVHSKKMHYTAYKIDSGVGSGLELFDESNNLTEKGKVFVESFKMYPPTKF